MKPPTLLLIVLGTILGPVYFAYCEYLSGETAEMHTLTDRADRWELPDGVILRFRGGLGYRPVVLKLTPELNLYRFRFTFDAGHPGSKESANDYQVRLQQGDIDIYQHSFRVAGSGTLALDPLAIPYGGSYVLLLEEASLPQLQVAGVKLEIRTRVEKVRMWLVWGGLAMLALGAAIVIRDYLMPFLKK
ncbi:MAG TPA: hypothetical protein VN664_05715 [Burkholderiales bacterium]|nr:hypothetical protein [Burkholderiales bacterium]